MSKSPRVKHSLRHLILLLVWIALCIPTLLWWRESIAWVVFMSIYALISTHWSAYEAAKAAEKQEDESVH